MLPLTGRIAVVAGATRGAGRGIACALGEAGATVYCTGRSTRQNRAPGARPETIDETAEMVTALGGRGVPVAVDHTDGRAVAALADRLRADHGRVDVLVNDVWGGDALMEMPKPFWQLDLDKGRRMLEGGLWTHVVTARAIAPLVVAAKGLIVEITDGDGFGWRGNLFYDLVKMSVVRLAWAMSRELAPRGATAIAVTPGFLRSEEMLDRFGVTESTWRDGAALDPNFLASETPRYVGRAVAALAADPAVRAKSGRVFSSWALAAEYGFTDLDGSRPDWGDHFRRTYGRSPPVADEGAYASWRDGACEIAFPDWPIEDDAAR